MLLSLGLTAISFADTDDYWQDLDFNINKLNELNPIFPICFLAGTSVLTDQGSIAIEIPADADVLKITKTDKETTKLLFDAGYEKIPFIDESNVELDSKIYGLYNDTDISKKDLKKLLKIFKADSFNSL
mgnify:CR=1 FL=1